MIEDRLSKDKRKRSWHICPRCQRDRINRDLRKCMACEGKVVWYGDDSYIGILNNTMTDWYMWYNHNNLKGWYHSSFFRTGWK